MIELTRENKIELYRRLIKAFRIRSILFMSVLAIISFLSLWAIFLGVAHPGVICEIVNKGKYPTFVNILFTIPFCFPMAAYSSSVSFIQPLSNNTLKFGSYRDWSWSLRLLIIACGVITVTAFTLIFTQDDFGHQTITYHIVLCIGLLGLMIANLFKAIQFHRAVMDLREDILSD